MRDYTRYAARVDIPVKSPAMTIPLIERGADLREKTELGDIYNLPGEGFVVELRFCGATHLFDRQGLQHRILQKKREGLDASVEEAALIRINNFSPDDAGEEAW